MKFTVKFVDSRRSDRQLYRNIEDCGLIDLGIARKEFGPEIDTVLPHPAKGMLEPHVILSEDEVLGSSSLATMFADVSSVRILVVGSFQKYTGTEYELSDEDNNVVIAYTVLSSHAIKSDWIAAGCPLKWEIGE
jgi:hypothetical protein